MEAEINELEQKPELDIVALSKRKMWYSKPFILFAMLDWAKGREVCFLRKNDSRSNIRYINAGSLEMFMRVLGITTRTEMQNKEVAKDPYKFFNPKNNYGIYCSMAQIDWERCPIKVFSYAIKERQNQQKIMREELIKYVTDFTAGIDFDGDQDYTLENGKEVKINIDISQEDAVLRSLKDLKVAIKIFNEYKIQWWVQFSGNRGFNLFFDIPLNLNIMQKVAVANEIIKTLAETFDLKTLDKTPYNFRKVFKCPYSIQTQRGFTRVILPMSDDDLENFNLEKTEVTKVYYEVKNIKTRGLLIRNRNINELERVKLFKKFLKDYEVNLEKIKEENKDG